MVIECLIFYLNLFSSFQFLAPSPCPSPGWGRGFLLTLFFGPSQVEQPARYYSARRTETLVNLLTCQPIFGASNLYNTGVTILVSNVLLISPPIITRASGEYNGLFSITSGSNPPIAVKVVKIIGTNRVSPDSCIALSRLIPCLRS